MIGAIAIFVKTPGLSPIKTRLARGTSLDQAAEFYRLSYQAVSQVIEEAIKQSPIKLIPYWAVAEKEGMQSPIWQDYKKIYQEEGELGQRLHHVYSTLLRTHDFVMLLGADCPQITPYDLCETAQRLSLGHRPFVIGRALDGGFWLFGGARALPMDVWLGVPYSSDTTANKLCKGLAPFGNVVHTKIYQDIDTREDLVSLYKSLSHRKDCMPSQDLMVKWLKANSFA